MNADANQDIISALRTGCVQYVEMSYGASE